MDHVPPKSIFPPPRPIDLITVPACDRCNGASSPNDEEFKVGLSLLAGTETPETEALWKHGTLRTLAHNRRLWRQIMSQFVKVEVRSAGGIYLGTEDAVLIRKHGIHAVLERTIRGLYYHHFNERLGARARVDVQRYQNKLGDGEAELGKFVMSLPFNSIAGGALRYRYGRAADGPLSSLWFMLFFGTVAVFGYSIARDDSWQPSQPIKNKDRA